MKSAKQKSFTKFTGWHNKQPSSGSFDGHQSFRQGPLFQKQHRCKEHEFQFERAFKRGKNFLSKWISSIQSRILSPKVYERVHPIIKRLISLENIETTPTSNTAQKYHADLVTFTEKILNGKIHFLRSED